MFSTQPEPAGPLRHWPADQVERWSIERLKTHASNPRLHSEADLGKIAASILKWGWTMPVLVDDALLRSLRVHQVPTDELTLSRQSRNQTG